MPNKRLCTYRKDPNEGGDLLLKYLEASFLYHHHRNKTTKLAWWFCALGLVGASMRAHGGKACGVGLRSLDGCVVV